MKMDENRRHDSSYNGDEDGSSMDMWIAEAMVWMASSTSESNSASTSSSYLEDSSASERALTANPIMVMKQQPPPLYYLVENENGHDQTNNELLMVMNMEDLEATSLQEGSNLSDVAQYVEINCTPNSQEVEQEQFASSSSTAEHEQVFTFPPQDGNFLLSAILQGNEELKAEFQSFVARSEAQCERYQSKIDSLQENLGSYQEQLEQIRFQREREGCLQEESQTKMVQDLREDLCELLRKVKEVIQNKKEEETSKEESNKRQESNSTYLASDLKILEDKIVSLEQTTENLNKTCQLIQDNLQSQTVSTSEKLDKILEMVVKKETESKVPEPRIQNNIKSLTPPEIPPTILDEEEPGVENVSHLESEPEPEHEDHFEGLCFEDAKVNSFDSTEDENPNSGPAATATPPASLEDEFIHHETEDFEDQSLEIDVSEYIENYDRNYIVPKAPPNSEEKCSQRFPLKSKLKRRKLDGDDVSYYPKHYNLEAPSKPDEDCPPSLRLPSRIVKNRLLNKSPDKMPILYPECSPKTFGVSSLENKNRNKPFRPSTTMKTATSTPVTAPIPLSIRNENLIVKNFNGMETIQLSSGISFNEDKPLKYDYLNEEEEEENNENENIQDNDVDEDYNFREERIMRRRAYVQLKRDIHGIKKERLTIHQANHSRDFSKTGYACMCGAKFTGAGGLYVHQVKMMEVEKFKCDRCGKRFHYFSGLKAHRKTTHKMEFTQQVGCSRCGQIFSSKKERQGHVDERGQTCWLSGSYQSKNWELIRNRRLQISSFMPR